MGWGSCTSHHPGRLDQAVAPGHASGFFPLGKNVDRFGSDFNACSIAASQQHRFLLLAAIAAHEKFPPDLRRFLLTVGGRAGRVSTALTRMALDSLLWCDLRGNVRARRGDLSRQPPYRKARSALPGRMALQFSLDPRSHPERCSVCS